MTKTFEDRKRKGAIGEKLVDRHLSKMLNLRGWILGKVDTTSTHIEGADFEVSFLVVADKYIVKKWRLMSSDKWKGKKWRLKGGHSLHHEVISLRRQVYPMGIVAGSVEVKTVSLKSFLKDNNYNDVKCGSIRIPVCQVSGEPGWLQRIATHDDPAVRAAGKSKRSLAVVFVIVDNGAPLFSIAFTDVSAFLNRVNEMLLPAGVAKMRCCPYEKLDEVLQPQRIYRTENLMYIPFSKLADIATVTWINGNNAETISQAEPGELYSERLNHLAMCAGDRRFYETDEPDRCLTHSIVSQLEVEVSPSKAMTPLVKIGKGIVLGGRAIDEIYGKTHHQSH